MFGPVADLVNISMNACCFSYFNLAVVFVFVRSLVSLSGLYLAIVAL